VLHSPRIYVFTRKQGPSFTSAYSFGKGDRVSLSVHGGPFGVSSGTVVYLTDDIAHIRTEAPIVRAMVEWDASKNIFWRLDKDEYSGTFSRLRGHIISLFANNNGFCRRKRELIVNLIEPTFAAHNPLPPNMMFNALGGLMDDNQKQAVETILRANDYAIILGMPGAGLQQSYHAMTIHRILNYFYFIQACRSVFVFVFSISAFMCFYILAIDEFVFFVAANFRKNNNNCCCCDKRNIMWALSPFGCSHQHGS
jgi:hypothetical protein